MNGPQFTAAGYHRATSYRRHALTPHRLDWAHQPVLDKAYPDCPTLALDREPNLPEIDYTDLVTQGPVREVDPPEALTRETVSAILQLTHAITGRQIMPTGAPFYYRSVASAGALYPFELYLASHGIDGLAPGLYHYRLFASSLAVLRDGPVPVIPPVSRTVAATFVVSGIFYRSAWKYRSRAYRYVLLDAGHLLENLRLALHALGLSFSIHLDFNDRRAADLLGVDPDREVVLACVHLYGRTTGAAASVPADDMEPLGAKMQSASRVSDRETAYADILGAHRSGSGAGTPAADPSAALDALGQKPAEWTPLTVGPPPATGNHVDVLRQRRSRRNFVPRAVVPDDWKTFMALMAAGVKDADSLPRACRQSVSVGILAGSGQPVAPGFYLLDAHNGRLGRVRDGRLIEAMAAACLDQMWLQHAGMHLLFMTDLSALDRYWGARGYRYAMIEAGRLGQQAYLAATAVGWGACGIGAIYDREAADLLQLTDDGVLLYLVGVGPVKRRFDNPIVED